MNKQKIIDLANKYATSFIPCFTEDTSSNYMRSFATKRWENTTEDYEIEPDERSNKECLNLFVDEFEKNVKKLLKEQTIIVSEDGKKTKLVKRKKG